MIFDYVRHGQIINKHHIPNEQRKRNKRKIKPLLGTRVDVHLQLRLISRQDNHGNPHKGTFMPHKVSQVLVHGLWQQNTVMSFFSRPIPRTLELEVEGERIPTITTQPQPRGVFPQKTTVPVPPGEMDKWHLSLPTYLQQTCILHPNPSPPTQKKCCRSRSQSCFSRQIRHNTSQRPPISRSLLATPPWSLPARQVTACPPWPAPLRADGRTADPGHKTRREADAGWWPWFASFCHVTTSGP